MEAPFLGSLEKTKFPLEPRAEHFPFCLALAVLPVPGIRGEHCQVLGILPAERKDGSSVLDVPRPVPAVPGGSNLRTPNPHLGDPWERRNAAFPTQNVHFCAAPEPTVGRQLQSEEIPRISQLQGSACPGVGARCSFGVNNSWDAFKASSVLPKRGPKAIKAWTCCLPTSPVISEP